MRVAFFLVELNLVHALDYTHNYNFAVSNVIQVNYMMYKLCEAKKTRHTSALIHRVEMVLFDLVYKRLILLVYIIYTSVHCE